MSILDERDFAHVGVKDGGTIRAEDVKASEAFRKIYDTLPNVVTPRRCRSSARPTA